MIKKILAGAAGAAMLTIGLMAPAFAQKMYINDSIDTGNGSVDCAALGGCVMYSIDYGYSEIDTGSGRSFLVDENGNIYE